MKPVISFALLVLVLTAGCETARVVDTWHDPAFKGPIRFKRTLVMAMTKDETVKRIAEDEMVKQIGEPRAVQSYKLLTDADRTDAKSLQPKLEANGIEGVVTMRLVDTRTETQWVPGSGPYPYDPFYSYYDRTMPIVGDPGYMRTDTIARVQTNIWSVADGKMIWTGVSESFNPENTKSTVGDICKAVAKQLKKEGLLTD